MLPAVNVVPAYNGELPELLWLESAGRFQLQQLYLVRFHNPVFEISPGILRLQEWDVQC